MKNIFFVYPMLFLSVMTVSFVHADDKESMSYSEAMENSTSLGAAKEVKDLYDKGLTQYAIDKAKDKAIEKAEEGLGKLIFNEVGAKIPIGKIITAVEYVGKAGKNIVEEDKKAVARINQNYEQQFGVKKEDWTYDQRRQVQQAQIDQSVSTAAYGVMVTAADAAHETIEGTKKTVKDIASLPGETLETGQALYDAYQTQQEFNEAFKGDKGQDLLKKVDKLILANSGNDDAEVQKLQSQLDDMKSGEEKTGQEKRQEWFDWEPPEGNYAKTDTAMDLTRSARTRLDELEEIIVDARVSPGSVTEEELKKIEKDLATLEQATDTAKQALRNLDIGENNLADIEDRNRVYKNTTSVQRTIQRLKGVKSLIETQEQKLTQEGGDAADAAPGSVALQEEEQPAEPKEEIDTPAVPDEQEELAQEPEPELLPICDDSNGTDSNCRPAEEPTIDPANLDNEGVCDQSCPSGQSPSCGKVDGQWYFTCIENEAPENEDPEIPDGPPPEEDWGLAAWTEEYQQANIEANELALKEIAEREALIQKQREEDWNDWRENGFELPEFKLPTMDIAGSDNQWRTYSWAEVFASNKSMRIAYLNIWQLAKNKEHNLKLAKQAAYSALGVSENTDSWTISQIYSQQFKSLQNLYGPNWTYSPMNPKAYAEYKSVEDYNEPQTLGGKYIQIHAFPIEMQYKIEEVQEIQNSLRGDKTINLSTLEQLNQKSQDYQDFYQSNYKKITIINSNLSSILPLDYQGKPDLYIPSPESSGSLAEVAFRVQKCEEGIKQLDETIRELQATRARIITDTATAMAMLKPVADRVAEIWSYERGSGQVYNEFHKMWFDEPGSKPYDTMALQELQKLAIQLGFSEFGGRYNQASEQLQSNNSTSLVAAYNSVFDSLREFGSEVGLRVSYEFVRAAQDINFMGVKNNLLSALKRATYSYIEDQGQLPPLPAPGEAGAANSHLYAAMVDRDLASDQQSKSNDLLAQIKASTSLDERRSLIASLCASIPEEKTVATTTEAGSVGAPDQAAPEVASLVNASLIDYKTIASLVSSNPTTVAQQELAQECKILREDLLQREVAAATVKDATEIEDPLKELIKTEEEQAAEAKKLAEEEALKLAEQKQQETQAIVDATLLSLQEVKQNIESLPGEEDSRVALEDAIEQAEDIVLDAKTELGTLSVEDETVVAPLDQELNLITELATQKMAASQDELSGVVSTKVQEDIQRLYQNFASAYSAKNLGALTALISEDWSSTDGSDIIDLEDTLANSFSVFEQVSYSSTALNIKALGDSRYEVTYHSKIVGQIYGQGISHSEEGEVVEIVGFEDGVPLILETRSGQLWR